MFPPAARPVFRQQSGEHDDAPAAVYVAPESVPTDIPLAFSDDAIVYAIGVYRAKPPSGYRPTYSGQPDSGDVTVTVRGKGKVVLVFSAHDPVRWIVQSRGAQVEQVVTFGYHEQEVVGTPISTEVYSNPTFPTGESRVYAYQRDEKFAALEGAILELTGKPVKSFQGSYNGDRFVVQTGQ